MALTLFHDMPGCEPTAKADFNISIFFEQICITHNFHTVPDFMFVDDCCRRGTGSDPAVYLRLSRLCSQLPSVKMESRSCVRQQCRCSRQHRKVFHHHTERFRLSAPPSVLYRWSLPGRVVGSQPCPVRTTRAVNAGISEGRFYNWIFQWISDRRNLV